MTSKTINANVLTSSGKYDSSAAPDGNPLPILLGRMDVSMVANDANLIASAANVGQWGFNVSNPNGSTIIKKNDGSHDYVRASYTAGGAPDVYVRFTFPTLVNEYYATFYVRKSAGGMTKFQKAFGKYNGAGNVANVTFKGGDYTLGEITTVSYGDGVSITNDTQFGASYDSGYDTDAYVGRSGALPRTFVHGGKFTAAEWGDGSQWIKFQTRWKQNSGTTSGNEINDGLTEVYINGVLRCAAYNIYNRHYSNLGLDYVDFLSYTQSAPAFTMDIRGLTISTGGWID